jgi:predicted metal-dependent hydrolase
MKLNSDYQIGHAYIDNQVIMYKLYVKHTRNSYIRVTRDNQIEVIASTYMSKAQLESFINKYIGKIYKHTKQRNEKQLIDLDLNYIHVFAKKYLVKIVKTQSKKSYEFVGNTIYLHLHKESDRLLLIKKMYLVETAPYMKIRFTYWEKTMNLKATLLFK